MQSRGIRADLDFVLEPVNLIPVPVDQGRSSISISGRAGNRNQWVSDEDELAAVGLTPILQSHDWMMKSMLLHKQDV